VSFILNFTKYFSLSSISNWFYRSLL
jgi:hypothetical protein